MAEMNRRQFLGAFAATVAAAFVRPALPSVSSAWPAPAIGTEFYTVDFVGAGSNEEAWSTVASTCVRAMRRVEQDRGVVLGNFRHVTTWAPERAAWIVNTVSSVIGHA